MVGVYALGKYNDKCPDAPIDESRTNRQQRHAKVFPGEMDWDVIHDGPWLCDHCKQPFEADTGGRLYDTPSGELEPGCLFWSNDIPENYYWDNHKGAHLCAILPNGHHWNIDSRASNCGKPKDRTHRCWVRVGEAPNVHIDKRGETCDAGAGSIWSNQGEPDEWHGFLHHGEFKKC